jgi:hypothetical protein
MRKNKYTNSDYVKKNRYAFSLGNLRRDRTTTPAPSRPASQEELLEMIAGDRPIPPGSSEMDEIERAQQGEIILENLWTPGETFTAEEWQKNLDDSGD